MQNAFCDIRDFGGAAGGKDCAEAIRKAAAAASAIGGASVFIPAGRWSVQAPIVFDDAIQLVGAGAVGASDRGTIIACDWDSTSELDACFQWKRGGPVGYQGTGGGISQIRLVKPTGRKGGTAIRLFAQADNHRPGWFQLDRVTITIDHFDEQPAGAWLNGVIVDGLACTTVGGQGIRDLHMSNLNIFGCNRYAFALWNAVHVNVFGLQVAPAGNPNRQEVLISGGSSANQQSTCVNLYGLDISGRLAVANTNKFRLDGFASVVVCDRTAKRGILTMQYDDVNILPGNPGGLVVSRA